MMKGDNVTVRDQTRSHLESLFRDVLDIPDLVLDETNLGGMSNLNLHAFSEDTSLVVRIPALNISLSSSYYEKEFRVCLILSENGLSPEPYAYGVLPDEKSTPFLAYHYETGEVHSRLDSMSHADLHLLSRTLNTLNSLHIAGMPEYSSARDYQNHLFQRANSLLPRSSDLTWNTMKHIESLRSFHEDLMPITKTLDWTPVLIHGDLRPSNIVFQDERVIFLDWSEFSMGDALFDLAYLLTEPSMQPSQDTLSVFSSVDPSRMLAMQSLALFSSLSWTVERLIRCELGQIASSLSTREIIKEMDLYLQEKTNQFNQVISELRST